MRAMRGLLTSQEQDGWRELINKEVFCRISWKAKYGRKYPQRLSDHGISRQKCLLPDIYLPKEDSSSRNREGAPQKEDHQAPAEEKVGLSLQEPLPEMRVPTPETTQLLYKGFSHEGKGRQKYLKERMMKSPEEKFWYPVLSSWEYGWRLGYFTGCPCSVAATSLAIANPSPVALLFPPPTLPPVRTYVRLRGVLLDFPGLLFKESTISEPSKSSTPQKYHPPIPFVASKREWLSGVPASD